VRDDKLVIKDVGREATVVYSRSLVDTGGFETEESGLEESFRSAEAYRSKTSVHVITVMKNHIPLIPDGDNLTVRKLVALLKGRRLSCGLELLLKVEGDVAKLLLDVTNDFTLGGGGEGVATFHQVFDKEVGQVTTSEIETKDSMRESEAFIDGDSVGNTITGIEHDTGRTTRCVEGEDSLDGDVEGGTVESLEHDLGHLLSVSLGVERSFGQENGVFFGGNSQLVVEGVMPNLLHVIPVGDNTVFDGVLEGEDTTLGLSLITGRRGGRYL
jgi:hypothetical protein